MQQAEAAARTMAGSSLTSHVCRLGAVRISLSPSLSQKSTYDERYPPPFIPLSFVFCLCCVEGWRVLPQVEDATAAASLVGLTGEKRGRWVLELLQQHVVAAPVSIILLLPSSSGGEIGEWE